MKRIRVTLNTTDTGGDSTTYGPAIFGKLYAVKLQSVAFDTAGQVVITAEADGDSKPLLTASITGTAAAWFYPRDLVHAVANGAALTGTSGGDRAMPIVEGRLKFVVSAGGASSVGAVAILYIEE